MSILLRPQDVSALALRERQLEGALFDTSLRRPRAATAGGLGGICDVMFPSDVNMIAYDM